MVKKIIAVFITVLLSSFMIVPAFAATYDGQGKVTSYWSDNGSPMSGYVESSMPLYNSSIYTNAMMQTAPVTQVVFSSSFSGSGTIGIYASVYGHALGSVNDNLDNVTVTGQYTSSLTGISYFTPEVEILPAQEDTSASVAYARGLYIKGNIQAENAADTISQIIITVSAPNYIWSGDSPVINIPNYTIITTESSAELGKLEEITDTVNNIYEINNYYYGEVITKIDNIYQQLGTTNGLLEESIQQFENWNSVTEIPSQVTDKTDKADSILEDLESLDKPDPVTIVPELTIDTSGIADVLNPYFQNSLILQILMMSLGFALVSYVLFGKK